MELKYVGQSLPSKDAVLKVTGQMIYTGDMYLNNMLYAKLLLSPIAHGLIKAIDTSAAEALPGVVKVFTHADVPRVPYNSYIWYFGQEEPKTEFLLTDKVRFVGDRVAVVVAESPEAAARAVKMIKVKYEKLPVITDPREALKDNQVAIHPDGNLLTEVEYQAGDPQQVWSRANVIITDKITTPRTHHAAMEPHACLAACSPDGGITIWTPCQGVYGVRANVAEVLNLPLNKVRVIKAPAGGSFGGKQETLLEPLAAFLARATGRPVRLVLDRRETILATRTRTATVTKIKTAVSGDGTLLARDIEMVIDAGAYTANSRVMAKSMGKKHFRLYRIPHMHFKALAAYTNTPVAGGHRAWGSPQVCAASEIHMEHIARELGLDPVDLRLKNLVHPYDPDPLSGHSLGNARIIDCLVKGAEEFDWYQKRQRPKDTGRYRRGTGVACGSHPISYYTAHHDLTSMTLKMHEDGSLTVNTGMHDVGCGIITTIAQIVAEVLDIEPGLINVLEADTERGLFDIGTYASRNTYMGGACALKAARKLKKLLLEQAAIIFKTTPDYLAMGAGMVWAKGRETLKKSYGEIVTEAMLLNQADFIVTVTHRAPAMPVAYAAHLAEVEVDTLTGLVRVVDYVAVHDVGKAINPGFVEGQIHGGIQMGIGFALCEEIKIAPDGLPVNDSFKDYIVVNTPEMPEIRTYLIEAGEEGGPFGAKGVGEIATVPVAPAVVNAVNDALGTNLNHLPLSPEKILAALAENIEDDLAVGNKIELL